MTEPLFPVGMIAGLRKCLAAHYGSVAVGEALGLAGEGAMSRADLAGVDRLTRGGTPTDTFVRLFLLGLTVSRTATAAALAPVPVDDAVTFGLLETAGDDVRAALDVRPYSDDGGPDWWLVSDLGADVRPGRLHTEHVLGLGSAGRTLAQATIRTPTARALDVGTGCGIQALHLSRHARSVVATDLSERALRFAATTAALSGQAWDLRAGSLLEPVADEQFDLIVCNPPFIVGPGFAPGADGFSYRDSGLSGDSVCERLVRGLPGRLTDRGTAQLLANWVIGLDEPWSDRIAGWLPDDGVDAWVWQREVADPGEYAALWLRDAGETPGTERWRTRYDRWLDWFAATGVAAVGMGQINLRRTAEGRSSVVCEDVPQAYQRPIGVAIDSWFDRAAWLRATTVTGLLGTRFTAAADLVLSTRSLLGEDGWQAAQVLLRQSHGMRWELEVDDAVSALVAACATPAPLGVLLELIASTVGAEPHDVTQALVPVVRDLIGRGFLLPEMASRS